MDRSLIRDRINSSDKAPHALRTGGVVLAAIAVALVAVGCERDNVPSQIGHVSSSASGTIQPLLATTIGTGEQSTPAQELYLPASLKLHENAADGNVTTYERD